MAGQVGPGGEFAGGKPGWLPGRLALATVLQKAANLTDGQAADEVRENLAWKYGGADQLTAGLPPFRAFR